MSTFEIRQGDCLEKLREMPDESVHMVCTSPPYWGLRSYGTETWEGGSPECDHKVRTDPHIASSTLAGGKQTTGHQQEGYKGHCGRCGATRQDRQLGLEATPDEFVANMVEVFAEVRRVLRKDGTCWLNIGDSYAHASGGYNPTAPSNAAGHYESIDYSKARGRDGQQYSIPPGLKVKDLCMIPARLALALQADGWWIRSEITWCKRAPMPESVRDRPTSATEKIYLLTKSDRYFYDADAVRERQSEATLARFGEGQAPRKVKSPKYMQADALVNNGDAFRAVGILPDQSRNMWNYWILSPDPFSDWVETYHPVRVSLDAVSDDTKRITSSDCPVHGDHPAQVASLQYGQREGDGLSHTSHTDAHPVPALAGDSVPTQPIHASGYEVSSSDLPDLACSTSATDHNTQTSRTAHAPVTTEPCMPSVETHPHTGDMSELPASSEPHGNTPDHNNGLGGSDAHSQAQTPFHIAHKSSLVDPLCTCTFYKEITEKSSHFATFPREIPRRAILAGTSERGVCGACGAPWKRVVGEGIEVKDAFRNSGRYVAQPHGVSNGSHDGGTPRAKTGGATIGWTATCPCDAPTVPATVLDPFAGAGTTLLVAVQHGRRGLGIELNPDYISMAMKRIHREGAPLFAWADGQQNGSTPQAVSK